MTPRTYTYTIKLFGLFPVTRTIQKPTIYKSTSGLADCYICHNDTTVPGYGRTQLQACNDWADGALV